LPYLGAFGIPPAARLFLAEPGWLVQKVIQVKPGVKKHALILMSPPEGSIHMPRTRDI